MTVDIAYLLIDGVVRLHRVINIKLRLFHDLLRDPRNKFELITRGTLSHL